MTQTRFIAQHGVTTLLRTLSHPFYLFAAIVLASSPNPLYAQQPQWPQGIHQPQTDAMKNAESTNQNVKDRLKDEQQNKYRGGAGSKQDVVENMKQLFGPILLGSGQNIDQWYSPYLRDSQYNQTIKQQILPYRYKAGASLVVWDSYYQCYHCMNGDGGFETACPKCQPKSEGGQGCPENKKWLDEHLFEECCADTNPQLLGRGTKIYKEMTEDSNFRTCCVRNAEVREDTEKIACKHPDGSGWSGVFEYYYPTEALGWENDRTTSMIAEKDKVSQCVKDSRPLMHDAKAVDWVEKAINKNIEVAEKIQGGGGAGSPVSPGNLKQKIQEGTEAAKQIPEPLQFTDSLQSQGLTLRVNFPAMDPEYRRKLAEHFCMHPEQFMKLMDPNEDLLQKEGGPSLEALHEIPIWSNYCPQGVQLMTDPDQTSTCQNVDGTPTELDKGLAAWKKDPLYCQRMNLSNPAMQEYFGQTLAKVPGQTLDEQAVGYTCMRGGKLNGSLAPVELYRYAGIERRAAIGDSALGFLIAGGLYKGIMLDGAPRSGARSFYKRFEPQPYSMNYPPHLQIFIGKPFKGSGSGPKNELQKTCPAFINGRDNYFQQNKSDQIFIADMTHQNVFPGEREMINEEAQPGFNRNLEEWAQASGGNKVRVPNRGLDKDSNNYAAVFRLFATCPAKFKRWHPPGEHDTYIQELCRDENFGGYAPPQ